MGKSAGYFIKRHYIQTCVLDRNVSADRRNISGYLRSGATIVGALLLGVSRTVAAEYTFFLAIPVMFGASLLKLVKFGLAFSAAETAILLTGMVVAFVVSLIVIRFLMGYIKSTILKCLAGIGSFLARSCFYAEYADCFRNWKKSLPGTGNMA